MARDERQSFRDMLQRCQDQIFASDRAANGAAAGGTSRKLPSIAAFASHAGPVMDHLVGNLDRLASDFFAQLARSRSEAATVMREDNWHLGSTSGLIAFVRLSKSAGDYFYASGNYSLIQNIDVVPLQLTIYRLDGSIDVATRILPGGRDIVLIPGERIVVDGTREIAGFRNSGTAVAVILTSNLSTYDATFDISNGKCAGRIMADLQSSAAWVALKLFAAAGWKGGDALARQVRHHPVPEVRWAVLNFLWQCDAADDDGIRDFLSDPEPEIRAIAADLLAPPTSGARP